jgi:hypothetical protein
MCVRSGDKTPDKGSGDDQKREHEFYSLPQVRL